VSELQFVYRVTAKSAWRQAQLLGHIPPSPLDERDGFIHLSSVETMLETARRYFQPEEEPLIVELSAEELEGSLHWEVVATRGGQRFPHLYAPSIPLSAVTGLISLRLERAQLQLGARTPYPA